MLDRPKTRVLAWLLAYIAASIVITPLPRPGGILPWYPPLAVTAGVLCAAGLGWLPLVAGLALFGGWFVAGPDPSAIALYALPAIVESVFAAVLLRRLVVRFERGEDALRLVVVSLATAVVGASSAWALTFVLSTPQIASGGLWSSWAMCDIATLVTLLPLVLLVVDRQFGTLQVPRHTAAPAEIPVIFGMGVLLVGGSAVMFGLDAEPAGVLSALWVIPIAWMAVRYERFLAALVVAVMATAAFLLFTRPGAAAVPTDVVNLQTILIATGLIGVLISSALVGRRQAIASLEHEQARLRHSEAQLADAAAIGGIGSWEMDVDGSGATWSEELYRIMGVEVGATVDADTLPSLLEPVDADLLRAGLAEGAATAPRSLRFAAPDGSMHSVVVSWRTVDTGRGGPGRIVGVVRDVTEEAALQEQLLQAQRVESIGMLAGGVAHDFNNLLTVIAGFTEFARLSAAEGQSPDGDLGQVQAAVERARSLTAQLLAYGRRAIIRPESIDLAAAVSAVTPMLGRLLGEHIEVTTDLTRAPVVIDPGQLDQVIVNLAVNARDAMPSGGRLRIATGQTERDGVVMSWLEVRDDGIGMEPEVAERIFMPFFTTKERGRGTGLGLSTVYGIVTQAGGQIGVTSAPGAGSTFRIDFPAAGPEGAQPTAPEAVPSVRHRGLVLYVEDEAIVRRVGERALTRAGFDVVAAANARDARQLADRRSPDILVSDVVLPGGTDGITLAEELRTRWPALPVLLVSGYSERVPPSWAPLLPKPFEPDQLTSAVARLLVGGSVADAAAAQEAASQEAASQAAAPDAAAAQAAAPEKATADAATAAEGGERLDQSGGRGVPGQNLSLARDP